MASPGVQPPFASTRSLAPNGAAASAAAVKCALSVLAPVWRAELDLQALGPVLAQDLRHPLAGQLRRIDADRHARLDRSSGQSEQVVEWHPGLFGQQIPERHVERRPRGRVDSGLAHCGVEVVRIHRPESLGGEKGFELRLAPRAGPIGTGRGRELAHALVRAIGKQDEQVLRDRLRSSADRKRVELVQLKEPVRDGKRGVQNAGEVTLEGRGKREEGRGKREEGRGKREEGRGKREEGPCPLLFGIRRAMPCSGPTD